MREISQHLSFRYRNLALEFNKELLKNGEAKRVFTLIGEAYDVLSDPLRRAVFDQYGEEGLKRGVPTADSYIPPYHYHGDPMVTYRYCFLFIFIHFKCKFIYWKSCSNNNYMKSSWPLMIHYYSLQILYRICNWKLPNTFLLLKEENKKMRHFNFVFLGDTFMNILISKFQPPHRRWPSALKWIGLSYHFKGYLYFQRHLVFYCPFSNILNLKI